MGSLRNHPCHDCKLASTWRLEEMENIVRMNLNPLLNILLDDTRARFLLLWPLEKKKRTLNDFSFHHNIRSCLVSMVPLGIFFILFIKFHQSIHWQSRSLWVHECWLESLYRLNKGYSSFTDWPSTSFERDKNAKPKFLKFSVIQIPDLAFAVYQMMFATVSAIYHFLPILIPDVPVNWP